MLHAVRTAMRMHAACAAHGVQVDSLNVFIALQGCAGLRDIVEQFVQNVAEALQQLGPLKDPKAWAADELQDELLTRCAVRAAYL